ncbi:helix-turn-helix transcriptional regulator [Bradyrhizobium diazoefficiens]|uniref:AraC family transcriptional regulator n=1 Tax=Bradyrhizobium diazoefficiens TaxID=1355477 RepID=UPI00190A616D|nr:helix-turn-helix domain-containing protein [Bradyrhizobium diazoefficiens]QQO15442.1 helix-turn-helix transcriptional regulator [Bradyrhizobium diazoefficiens]
MTTLEAALRGGAVVILLLRATVAARSARRDAVSRYAAPLAAGIAAYIVESAPGFGTLDLRLRIPVAIVSAGVPAAFWIAMGAMFTDEFRPRWYHALGWLALVGLALMDQFKHPMEVDVVRTGLSVAFLLLGAWHALSGRAIDLVEGRRRLRIWYAAVTVLYALVAIASDWLWPGGLSAAPVSLANAATLTIVIFLFAVLGSIIAAETQLAPAALRATPSPLPSDSRPAAPATGPEAAQLAALQHVLDHDKVFREPDLSIASLSQKLDIPEYRLRHLINRQLGHRNFNAFVNGYRLAEAEAALSDPAQAGVPILTIALDAGFGSIGPFNRAFKVRTGLTPSEYRRTRLAGAEGAVQSRVAVGPDAAVGPHAAET